MQKSFHLVMPMGGRGSRFSECGYAQPKPLIQLKGKPFFFWAVQSVKKFIEPSSITFVVLEEHCAQWQIDTAIQAFYPDAAVIVIPKTLPGPVWTCLKGIEGISDLAPILFNDCDHLFKCSALNRQLASTAPWCFEGGLLTFQSTQPQFGYVKYNAEGEVIGTAEKRTVSTSAICGAYLFKNIEVFQGAADRYLGIPRESEYFMSGVYDTLCGLGARIEEFPVDYHVNFGTPEEYEQARKTPFFTQLI